MAMLKGKPVQLKNAVMMLNEMFPPPRAPQYKVTSQTGPPNNPTFSMVCCIQDQQFPGEGIYSGFLIEFEVPYKLFQYHRCRKSWTFEENSADRFLRQIFDKIILEKAYLGSYHGREKTELINNLAYTFID